MKLKQPAEKRNNDLSDEELEDLAHSFDELENVDSYELSEADVACDNLASELIEKFLAHKKANFTGRTPSLYEVTKKMRKEYEAADDEGPLKLSEDAAYELKNRLEDAYREDREEDISEEVSEWASTLISALKKFIEGKSWSQA